MSAVSGSKPSLYTAFSATYTPKYMFPIRFGMALAMNHAAMEAYAAMTEQQKQAVLNTAHNAGSEKEMHEIVDSIAK